MASSGKSVNLNPVESSETPDLLIVFDALVEFATGDSSVFGEGVCVEETVHHFNIIKSVLVRSIFDSE